MGNGGSLTVGLIGGVLGAVIGAGAVLALRPPPAVSPAPASDTDALRAALADALRPLVDELRTERGSSVADRGRRKRVATEPAADASERAPIEPVRGGTRTLPAPSPSETPLRADDSVWTPPPNFQRLKDLTGFEDDIRIRQRWLFVSERQALAAFGTPTNVYLSDNGETWYYDGPNIETEDEILSNEDFRLVFSRGRLVQVHD